MTTSVPCGSRRRIGLHSTSRTLVAVATLISGAILVMSSTSGASASQLVARRIGQVPHVSGAVQLGALRPSTRLHVDVELLPRNPAALAHLAAAVSTPGNPLYRHFLARGQFASRFGPTSSAISTVVRQLESDHLSVGAISSDHLSIRVSGSAGDFERAFSIGFSRYRLADGSTSFANTRAPLFAGRVSPYVQGVVGLNDLVRPHALGLVRASGARPLSHTAHVVTGGPEPCPTAVAAAGSNDAYTADQLAAAYNFSALYGVGDEGAGTTVAIFELEPDHASDISAYQACYGTKATVTYVKVDGGAGSGKGSGEAALDIEDVIGLAPKAAIDVYQAPNSNTGALDDYTQIVDKDVAKVISTSWGECEGDVGASLMSAEETLFELAAVQGQSVFAAAGDNGSSDCGNGRLAVDDPASQPDVTGVGGTTLYQVAPAPVESVWNESRSGAGAGGGGVSSWHRMPTYQSGAPHVVQVVNTESSAAPCKAPTGQYCREVPDVSADADPYGGYLVYYANGWMGIGGTSAAAPLWAAFAALADSSSTCAGKPIGFANPGLYAAAASSYSLDFNDVVVGTNDYTPSGYKGGKFPAGFGYDMASGLGTPNAGNLAANLCGTVAAPTATTTTLAIAKPSVTYGAEAPEAFTATVTGAIGDGQPLGSLYVYNGFTRLCTVTLVGTLANAAGGTCNLGATELGASLLLDVFAVYKPSATSSTTAGIVYGLSGSTPAEAFAVNRDTSTTQVSVSPSSVTSGQEAKAVFTVSVVSHLGELVPKGEKVVVKVGPSRSCTVTLRSDKGSCSISNSALPAGSYDVSAAYRGDANLASSSASAPAKLIVVAKGS